MSDELTTWLLEQIAEDERVARDAWYDGQRWIPEEEAVIAADQGSDPVLFLERKRDAKHAARWSPAHVLAECEGKRRIIEAHSAELMDVVDGVEHWTDCADCRQGPPCHTLRLLALPFADRPGYREEWRP